ncbi:MAG TPA: glutamate-5-semialdehyde dehydrogenase [Dehalococcoidia bacterium]|nr:glutamate-5-semialdehyde dehydrogenase [Dehalococcoidia bacterium]
MTTTPASSRSAAPNDSAAGASAELRAQVVAAHGASRVLGQTGTEQKNAALASIADRLRQRTQDIVTANAEDLAAAKAAGTESQWLDRILLDADRVENLANSLANVIALPDPVGVTIDESVQPSGLRIGRVRVPLGLIASIYENRPNVTIDIAALCLKSGNAAVLRGGREAVRSNTLLASILHEGLHAAGLPPDAVQLVRNPDRALVGELLQMRDLIDLMIPRGGKALIERVIAEAKMPVVAGGIGICHTYVDAAADLSMAVDIVDNAKTRRVSICNALDVVLVHQDVASTLLPALAQRWGTRVEVRADETSLPLLTEAGANAIPVGPDDYDTEFLAMRCAVRVVENISDALQHIEDHGSGHSEAIVTGDYGHAERFLNEVDAAAVFVNASTQFSDGGEFGLGAEVGIATGKMHARGPMALRELTSYKWIVRGDGQTRP